MNFKHVERRTAVDKNPLFALTSLQTLSLQWIAAPNLRPLQVESGFTALHELSHIQLLGGENGLRFEVRWEDMHVLQSLTLACDLYCDNDMLGLSRSTSLRCLNLAKCRTSNDKTSRIMGTLVDNMHMHCPNVEVLFID